jgi:hypothetical protein
MEIVSPNLADLIADAMCMRLINLEHEAKSKGLVFCQVYQPSYAPRFI